MTANAAPRIDGVARAEFSAARPIAGWRVVATCFLMAVYAWGLGFYGLSVYVQHLGGLEGRSPALLSAATTFYFALGAAAMAATGRASAWFGWRALASLGVATMACAAAGVAWAPNRPVLFIAYAALAVGWAACSGTAISHIVGRWFHLRRGLALSLALTGASFGGILVVPLMAAAIGAIGPREGVTLTSLALAALMLPLVWRNLVEPNDEPGLTPAVGTAATTAAGSATPADPAADRRSDRAAAEALTDTSDRTALVRVGALFATGWFAQVAFLSLQIPLLAPRLGDAGAAAAVSATTGAAIAGRLVLGAVIDRLDHRWLTAASFLLQAAGMLTLLASDDPVTTFAGCLMFGFSVGNVITLPAVFAQHEFDRARYGTVIARVWTAGQLVFAFGPVCAGLLLQTTGAGWPVLAGCAVCQAIAALLCLRRGCTPRRRHRRHHDNAPDAAADRNQRGGTT